MPQPRPATAPDAAQTPPQGTGWGDVAAAGAVGGAVGGVAAVTPLAAGLTGAALSGVALGAAVRQVIDTLMGIARSRAGTADTFIADRVRATVPAAAPSANPDADPDDVGQALRTSLEQEAEYEAAYQAKMLDRLRTTVPLALQVEDPEERRARVRAVFEQEKRFAMQREEAMLQRAIARQQMVLLQRESPQGAFWLLSPFVAEHTADAVGPDTILDGPTPSVVARRWFDGELVEVETRSGASLSVTPNHPVLTEHGWVKAGAVDVGDQLVRHLRQRGGLTFEDDVDDVPATVEEIYGALVQRPQLRRAVMPCRAEDFHGDGRDGYVDVVWAEGSLGLGLESPLAEELHDGFLMGRGLAAGDLAGKGGPCPRCVAVAAVGRQAAERYSGVSESLGDRAPGHLEALAQGEDRLAAPIGGDHLRGGSLHAPRFDAAAAQGGGDRASIDAVLASKLCDGDAGDVLGDEVVSVRRVPYSGHVYDVQTSGRWYTAGSLVVHNCLVLANQFWPWSFLLKNGPPRHHGCPCRLVGLAEAVREGLMRRDQVPDPEEALRRGTNALRDLGELDEYSTAEVGEYLAILALEEAARPRVRGSQRARELIRWAEGTAKGGEFRPKRGGDAGRRIGKLRGVRPDLQVPATSDRGRNTWVAGQRVRVPEASSFEKQVGTARYTSPPGTTRLFRDGEPMTAAAEQRERNVRRSPAVAEPAAVAQVRDRLDEVREGLRDKPREDAARAARTLDPGRPPIRNGAPAAAIAALEDAGFVMHDVRPNASGTEISYHHVTNGSRLSLTRGITGTAREVQWDPSPEPTRAHLPQLKHPEDFDAFAGDVHAWADSVGEQFGAPVHLTGVESDGDTPDHAGFHFWDGRMTLGGEIADDVELAADARADGRDLDEFEARGVWASYRAAAHELAHAVNPIEAEHYDGADAALEEALAEESAHVLAEARLREQGQGDVLAWRDANPDDLSVAGVYRNERAGLSRLLDDAGITDPDMRAFSIQELAFSTRPEDRLDTLAGWVAGGQGAITTDMHRDHVRSMLLDPPTAGPVERVPGAGAGAPAERTPFGKASPSLGDAAKALAAKMDAKFAKSDAEKFPGEAGMQAPLFAMEKEELAGGKKFQAGTWKPKVKPPKRPYGTAVPEYDGVELELGKGAGGSTGARFAKDPDGHRWLVKEYSGNRDRIATELVANAIYRDMGARVALAGQMKVGPDPEFDGIPDRDIGEPPLPDVSGTKLTSEDFDLADPSLSEKDLDKLAQGHVPSHLQPKPKRMSTGIIVREPDGRIWVYEPRGHYGGYSNTFPKGGLEDGLTAQQNAHKELWEETGLHAEITGYLGDYDGDTSVSRYYLAVRSGGEPTSGPETEAVKLLTPEEAAEALNKSRDQNILADLLKTAPPTEAQKAAAKDDVPAVAPKKVVLTYPTLDGKTTHITTPSAELGDHYMTDALLANWDFIGLTDDNVMWDEKGKPFRVDQGGTLGFRAQGGVKPFGDTPAEVWSLLGPKGQGYGKVAVSDAGMREQARQIGERLSDKRIDQIMDSAPFASDDLRESNRKALKGRVAWMRRFAKGEEQIPSSAGLKLAPDPQAASASLPDGDEAHALLSASQGSVTPFPEQEQALADFSEHYDEVQGHLRSGARKEAASDLTRTTVRELDSLLRHTKTADDVTVYLGTDPSAAVRESPTLGGMIGKSFGNTPFSLTAVDMDRAAEDTGAVMAIALPKGSNAYLMPNGNDVLLKRGQRFKIVGRRQVDGVLVVDAVAIGK